MASKVDNLIPSVRGLVRFSERIVADYWNTFGVFPMVRILDLIKRKNEDFIINATSVFIG